MSLLLLTAITSFHSCSDAYRGRTYATEEGSYATEEGSYATEEGNYATEEGSYATEEGSYATEEGPTLHHQDHQDDKEEINLLLIQRWIGKEPPGSF